MRTSTKNRLRVEGKEVLAPNRRQGKTLNLCTCGTDKKSHFGNRLGHTYKGGSDKNVVQQSGRVYLAA